MTGIEPANMMRLAGLLIYFNTLTVRPKNEIMRKKWTWTFIRRAAVFEKKKNSYSGQIQWVWKERSQL